MIRVMVTIAVQSGDGEWSRDRTLTLAHLSEDTIRDAWLAAFPDHLDRALRAVPEPVIIDDDDGWEPS